MRSDLIGPRPLHRPKSSADIVKGSPEWYAPFQTDEIIKADPFNMLSFGTVMGIIYEQSNLSKATANLRAPDKNIGTADTQQVSIENAPTQISQTQATKVDTSGQLPNVRSAQSINTPQHKVAMHEGLLDHHAGEYHRNNQLAGDSTQTPQVQAQAAAHASEHLRIGQNAQKVINHYQSQGVTATPKHHADLVNHYDQNSDNPSYAGGVKHPLQPSGKQLSGVHNPKSGNWDDHYGVSPKIAHEIPAKVKQPTTPKVTATSEGGTGVLPRGKLMGGQSSVPKTQVSQGGKTSVSPVQPTVVSSGEGAKMAGVKKSLRPDLIDTIRPLRPAKI